MARTLRLISENRKMWTWCCSFGRAHPAFQPESELEKAAQGKPHLYLLNKADLADEAVTARWRAYFKAWGAGCLALSSKQRTGMQGVKRLSRPSLPHFGKTGPARHGGGAHA